MDGVEAGGRPDGEEMTKFRIPRSAFRVRLWLVFVLVWVAGVLVVDTLAARGVRGPFDIDWRVLRWRGPWGADLFKFTAWFLVPLVLSLPRLDPGWFGVRRWRRADWWLLGGLAIAGAAAVAIIPLVPSLRATYGGMSSLPSAHRWLVLRHDMVWTLSWLLGWEFMHRYFLLRPLMRSWPRYGWLIIPVFEGAYHLQKPLIEAAGMVAFSLVLTYWAKKRQNALLPFLAHFFVELELMVFRVVM
ncbi:MAG: CPBP family intramembrane metalloprotease [Candidatus Hydrogenedentes bacterium]|nr:CPBP family intramembrane metalloprotease [Candidatus Hydrogenedentota bacterium]